jgi:radical S-adenosyl methionine domain-containing protein 2
MLRHLREAGTRKVTFVGGEPTLVKSLPSLVRFADELGMASMIATNGTGLTDQLLDQLAPPLTNRAHPGAVKFSLDSGIGSVEKALGRGTGHHVELLLNRAAAVRARGIPLMVNTVVTALNWQEEMHDILGELGPIERWKVLQVLRIEGQNDREWDSLKVTTDQFWQFVDRHRDLKPIPEDNNAMTESYVMVDPLGRFFQNTGGRHNFSRPILEVGVEAALSDVRWDRAKFLARGGSYQVCT